MTTPDQGSHDDTTEAEQAPRPDDQPDTRRPGAHGTVSLRRREHRPASFMRNQDVAAGAGSLPPASARPRTVTRIMATGRARQ